MNLKIGYFYRDASNYKTNGYTHVLAGPITQAELDEIRPICDDSMWFIPSQVGLPDSSQQFTDEGYALNDDDHVYNELYEDDGLELTDAAPTLELTAQALLGHFRYAKKNGWDCVAAMKKRGLFV